jgi:hypothetical protein
MFGGSTIIQEITVRKLLIFVMLLVGTTNGLRAQWIVDQQNILAPSDLVTSVDISSLGGVGQEFTPSLTYSGSFNVIQLQLVNPVPSRFVSHFIITIHENSITGNVVVVSDPIIAGSLGSERAIYGFNFFSSPSFQLSPGGKYVLELTQLDGPSDWGVSSSPDFGYVGGHGIVNHMPGEFDLWFRQTFYDIDSDEDGVRNSIDECPGTPAGAPVDATGCSIDQLLPCTGPLAGGRWKSHGQYVSSVAEIAEAFFSAGLITEDQKGAIVGGAAHSLCGNK